MSRPEIVGAPKLATGLATTGLGFEFVIPTLTSSNLIVAAGWKSATGANAALARVDGAMVTDSGMSSFSGSVGRCQFECWRNLSAGAHWVSFEPSGSGVLDNVWMAAVLLRDAGQGSTMLAAYTNPITVTTVPLTSRLLVFYWSYGASAIGPATHRPILEVQDLGNSLGALTILTGPGSGAGQTVGVTAPNESLAVAGYGIFPYAAA